MISDNTTKMSNSSNSNTTNDDLSQQIQGLRQQYHPNINITITLPMKKQAILLLVLCIMYCHTIPCSQSFSNNVVPPLQRQRHKYQHIKSYDITASKTNNRKRRRRRLVKEVSSLTLSSSYGKGSEIWPEPPQSSQSIQLADSFPNGIIPSFYEEEVEVEVEVEDGKNGLGRLVTKVLSYLSLSKADSQQQQAEEYNVSPLTLALPSSSNTYPLIAASVLLGLGLVKAIDVITVVSITGYIVILQQCNQNGNSLSGTIIPSFPPQGHVPDLVSNPLNHICVQSALYSQWRRFGGIISLVLPSLTFLWIQCFPYSNVAAATSSSILKALSTPLFLLSCQLITEILSKKYLLPLPLQILIPILYNTIRLPSLYNWVTLINTSAITTTSILFKFQSLLAFFNFVYWTLHLFAFLIPVASVRFMRAYFFCVEASSVTLRKENQHTIGLISP